jgi:hypothetical protein
MLIGNGAATDDGNAACLHGEIETIPVLIT